jgi:hypothetical protein
MNSSDTTKQSTSRRWLDLTTAIVLFCGTAAVVVWQNSRLGVLWDLSYILENSYRISLGDIPYRDFPFPYAPLTFLCQATLIKLTGRVFWHHIVYCAIIGGTGTVLTWRILLHQLRVVGTSARWLAIALSAPLVVLGIYCVYPHPFYDPDCTFVILLCIFLLQRLERRGYPPLPTLLTGALLVVPLFVKQNTGLAFLCSMGLALALLLARAVWERTRHKAEAHSLGGQFWLVAGAVTALLIAFLLIHFTAGLENYRHWTITFAASRRAPSLSDMLSVYRDHMLPWWLAAVFAGALLLLGLKSESTPSKRGAITWLVVALIATPFMWPVIYLFLDNDSSERAERLIGLWPFVLIVATVAALVSVFVRARQRERIADVDLVLPLVLIGVVHGAFLSQQLWGSTYAVWPLLMLLIAGTISTVAGPLQKRAPRAIPAVTLLLAAALFVAGTFYVRSHERLDYANLSDGDLSHSSLPALRGLSVRGGWLADFDELVRYTEKEIPRDDGILMLPGEDLFYYSTARHPRFPVLMFDHTVNPFSAEEILAQAKARDIRWLIIKQDIQLDEEPLENKNDLLKLLRRDFKQVESLNNYDIYRRRLPGEPEDDEKEEPNEPDDDKPDESQP